MDILLVDRDPELTRLWQQEMPNGRVWCGDIFDHPTDALVSPANSFGFMDGGIDLAYSTKLGWHVQDAVQRAIRDQFGGELLVGQALVVETGNADFPHLIAAPTMRVPMAAGIADAQGPAMFPKSLAVASADHFKTYPR